MLFPNWFPRLLLLAELPLKLLKLLLELPLPLLSAWETPPEIMLVCVEPSRFISR